MAVGWKHKGDKTQQKRENMTSMELAKQERQEHERRIKAREFAIDQTAKLAEELFKKVPRVLIHEAPAEIVIGDEEAIAIVRSFRYRWEFECLAVIRLARKDMEKSKFTRKYSWNQDWKEVGKLQMGRVLQQ